MTEDFTFQKTQEFIKETLGTTEWITVFSIFTDLEGAYFSYFVKNENTYEIMTSHSWDLHIGDGLPGFSVSFNEAEEEVYEYYNYNDANIVPIIFYRNFLGEYNSYLEPLQEFCLFFNLYKDNNKYYYIDESGDKEEVIIISEKEVNIKLKFLKEFITVKGMSLVLCFEFMDFREYKLNELGIEGKDEVFKNEDINYSFCIRDVNISEEKKSQSWILGKKIIRGLSEYNPDFFGKNKKYEEFIVGADKDGYDKYFTCNEDYLSNYFGKNEGNPDYLTPICFEKEVLKKYYDNTQKYTVEDGRVYAHGLRSLRIDNNKEDYVIVFLGDLGKLPHKEQLHWRYYNVNGERKLSYTTFQRAFMAEFIPPEQPDLYLKNKFKDFQNEWYKKFGWYLFLPLSEEDKHCFNSLRVPLNNEQSEFDQQVMYLTKVLIDSLNEKKLSKNISSSLKGKNYKGIDKLEMFIKGEKGDYRELINFLRDIQELRSTASAHVKGKSYKKVYEKLKDKYNIGEDNNRELLKYIIIDCIRIINTIEYLFLDD